MLTNQLQLADYRFASFRKHYQYLDNIFLRIQALDLWIQKSHDLCLCLQVEILSGDLEYHVSEKAIRFKSHIEIVTI